MVRRIASQVHKQASRLVRENYLKKKPAWFDAILEHPPLPLPPRAPPPRTGYDTQSVGRLNAAKKPATSKMRTPEPRPLPIAYIEDDIRRQFFQDHPFEAFRPMSLVEGGEVEAEHAVKGAEWTRLRQRGRNPSPDDCIRFAVNLHEHHHMPLTLAYSSAVAQYRSLRSEHHIASRIALLEAESNGITFGPTQIERTYAREEKALDNWKEEEVVDAGEDAARKRWRAIVEREEKGRWTRGQEYVRLWKEGVRPTYSPILAEPAITPSGLEVKTRQEIAASVDFMQIASGR